MTSTLPSPSCSNKPSLIAAPLLSPDEGERLAGFFKIVANGTRLRMLHALQRGELCVMELAELLAMKPQAVSNQLQRLLDRGVVASRREGNNMYYRITDPCVAELLEHGLCLTELGEPAGPGRLSLLSKGDLR